MELIVLALIVIVALAAGVALNLHRQATARVATQDVARDILGRQLTRH